MKNVRLLLSVLCVLALLASCQRENDKNPALIGHWTGKEWLVKGEAGPDASLVHFSFDAEGGYTAEFGDQKESGVWRTVKDKLYTKGEGRQEIMVKLLNLDDTTLKFEMNRTGRQETIELTKQQ